MNRHAPGIAGVCFLACGVMVVLAYASTLLREYGPTVRAWILGITDTVYAVVAWANDPKFFAGVIFAIGLLWAFWIACILDDRRFAR